jgi:acyl-CoA hydrolase
MARRRSKSAGKRRHPARKPSAAGKSAAASLPGKPVRVSQSEMVEVVLPNHANPLGNILGGRVMHLIDIAGAIACHRHCNSYAATASVDHVDFRTPIKVGNLIVLKSSVNRAFRTSAEVGVKVFAENILTGERQHTSSAYVTFVAVDREGRPKPMPPVIPETQEEWRRYHEAAVRRRLRLAQRGKKAAG